MTVNELEEDHGLPGWETYRALHLEFLLEKLPPAERPEAEALVDGAPPREALAVLENLVRLSAADRKLVYRASLDGPNERRKARALALALPEPVDPGLLGLREAVALLRKAVRYCRNSEAKTDIAQLEQRGAALLREMERARKASA